MIKEYEFHDPSFERRITKRSRLFAHALIISVAINLGLIATFSTFILREKRHQTTELAKPYPSKKLGSSNSEVLEEYVALSFTQLAAELDRSEIIEQGYARADLALSCLIAFHHFDIERALPGFEIQKRPFVFSHADGGEEIQINLVPGVDAEHFKAVKYFAKSEVWPLTSEGLFEEMKHRGAEIPASLKETFFMSCEFYVLQRAFPQVSKEAFLIFLLEGSWQQMEGLAKQIKLGDSHSGPFLVDYPSQLGAYMLIVLDSDYAYNQLHDDELLPLIEKLSHPTAEAKLFLSRLASSLRSDAVRDRAKLQLTSWGQEPASAQEEEIYVVKRGDSLWSLSRQFGVKISQIRRTNELKSDDLRPGQKLKIH